MKAPGQLYNTPDYSDRAMSIRDIPDTLMAAYSLNRAKEM